MNTRSLTSRAVVSALLLASAVPARADEPPLPGAPTVLVGSLVRAHLGVASDGRPARLLVGDLVLATNDRLAVRESDGTTTEFDRSRLESLEQGERGRSHALEGALVGALAGLAVGAASGGERCGGGCVAPATMSLGPVFASIGALVGLAVGDAARQPDRWHDVGLAPSRRPKVALGVAQDRVALSLSF